MQETFSLTFCKPVGLRKTRHQLTLTERTMSGPPRVYTYYQPPSESGLGGDAVKGFDLRPTVEEGLGNIDV